MGWTVVTVRRLRHHSIDSDLKRAAHLKALRHDMRQALGIRLSGIVDMSEDPLNEKDVPRSTTFVDHDTTSRTSRKMSIFRNIRKTFTTWCAIDSPCLHLTPNPSRYDLAIYSLPRPVSVRGHLREPLQTNALMLSLHIYRQPALMATRTFLLILPGSFGVLTFAKNLLSHSSQFPLTTQARM